MYKPKNEPTPPAVLPLAKPEKKQYEPPRIVYRGQLEAMASQCTPAPGKAEADFQCSVPFS